MSFEIHDLMVKLSSAEDDLVPGGGLPCGICQTTSRTGPGREPQCLDLVTGEPGEGDEPLDAPAPGYDGPPERGVAPSPGGAFALLQRQLQQALSQAAC